MRKIFLLGTVLCLLLLYGCDDIFEKDITNSITEIITPADGVTIQGPEILIWWNDVVGSDYYELQLVKPNFQSIESLIADTTLTSGKITLSIEAGTYEYRIRACNSAYCTDYSYRSFIISSN